MATATQSEKASGPCGWPKLDSVEENLRQARRVVNDARHAAEDAIEEAALQVRRHPLPVVGAAIVVGAVAGAVVGFCAGRVSRTGR